MQVSIKPGTKKRGMILKKEVHTIILNTQFTEEEKATVRELQIAKHNVIEQAPFGPDFFMDVTVSELMSGRDFVFELPTSSAAQDFIEIIKGSLANMKSHMETYSDGPSEEAFEL